MANSILRVQDLRTYFTTADGLVKAVDGVTFEVEKGETLGIVGESGCGKTVTALSILRLVKEPGRIVGGRILFGDAAHQKDIVQMTAEEIRQVRGNDIALIFQEPMTAANPVHPIGRQIREAMYAHERFTHRQAKERVLSLLTRVRIPAAALRLRNYPHQFSGGMLQRVMLAMGLSNEPSLLIADEPTTALDVTVQAQIIELLRELNRETGMAIILITHNLAVVASLCTRVLVMYAGRIVEQGTTRQIFKNPQHPYTWLLLRSIPRVDETEHERLLSITGFPPDLADPPHGCKFHPRCPFAIARCAQEEPPLVDIQPGQAARCWVLMKNVRLDESAQTT